MKGNNRTIGGGGFHHLAFKVFDFEKSVRFYTEALGLKPVMAWGEGKGRAIMLDVGDGACLEIFAGAPEQAKPEGVLMHFALCSDDCDAAIARAEAAGAVVTMKPTNIDIPSNPVKPVRIAFCKGFDGELIEFFQER